MCMIRYPNLYLVTLPTCARDKAISFVCLPSSQNCQISNSRHLCCCNYHELVDIVKKLFFLRFESLNVAH